MKLLVVTVLLGLLVVSAEGFRMPRQVEEEEQGLLTTFTNGIKSYYSDVVNTVHDYVDTVKGLKIEEKIKNLYTETSTIVSTYSGIFHDQLYHVFYAQQ
ncbi:apolipoprotein C-II [Phycodurus eques]|uniref:apolipoprotein C-II n=1 Tax=Phycodurus eques TaxID=693459 RepID=UPI002ACD6E87|nr:apolipoprotein C-II [Phycodurus eques]